MRFPKLTFRRRRRTAASSSSTAAPPPPLVPADAAPRSTFYALKSFSTVSFAVSRVSGGDHHHHDSLSSAGKTSGDGFVRKLARRIASKQELRSARRPPLTQLSFDDSDSDSVVEEERVEIFRQRVLPSPSPPPAGDRRQTAELELLSSVSPFCTDEEERMWRRYRADKARRASLTGLPTQRRPDQDVQIEMLRLDATEGGAGQINGPHNGASAFRSGRPTSILVTAPPLSFTKAVRRSVSCDALSKAYTARHSSQLAGEDILAYRLGHAKPAFMAGASVSRRISTRPAPPVLGNAVLSRCESPFKPASMGPTATQASRASRPLTSVASPLKSAADVSFNGYPDSIIYQYELSLESIDQCDIRPAVDSVVSDNFALDLIGWRSSSDQQLSAPRSVNEPANSEGASSGGSSPSSGTFDDLLDAAALEAGIVDDPARVWAEGDPDSPTTPEMTFIALAPFPSPLDIRPLSFHWDTSPATSTSLRLKDRAPGSAHPASRSVAACDSVEASPDDTSASLYSDASFSNAYFAVATRATTTIPRVVDCSDPATPPARPASPVSPPAQMSSSGKHEWQKLSTELGLPLVRAANSVKGSGRLPMEAGDAPSTSRPAQVEVLVAAANELGTFTPSEASLELFCSKLRATLDRQNDSTASGSPLKAASTSRRVGPTDDPNGALDHARVRRRMTPRYRAAGCEIAFDTPSVTADAQPDPAPHASTDPLPLRLNEPFDDRELGGDPQYSVIVAERTPTLAPADFVASRTAMLQAWLLKLERLQTTDEK